MRGRSSMHGVLRKVVKGREKWRFFLYWKWCLKRISLSFGVKGKRKTIHSFLFEMHLSSRWKQDLMILSDQNVTMSESGEYRCLAGNVLGETSSSIHLQINKSDRARLHWTVLGLILVYVVTTKWVCVIRYDLISDDLLLPEDSGGGDPLALHGDLHLIPPDLPLDHRGHPVSEDKM